LTLGFFYELVSPKTLSLLLGPFRFFRKLLEVFAAQGAPAVPVAKFAAGVVYTGGYTGVVDTGGAPSPRIKFERTLMLFLWAWGKMIHEKNCSKKSRDTVPLMTQVALVFYGKVKPFCSGTIISSRHIFYNK
jgi:hypothetical protein